FEALETEKVQLESRVEQLWAMCSALEAEKQAVVSVKESHEASDAILELEENHATPAAVEGLEEYRSTPDASQEMEVRCEQLEADKLELLQKLSAAVAAREEKEEEFQIERGAFQSKLTQLEEQHATLATELELAIVSKVTE
ncbi:unnamed protein product, partial [Polarella glacialis]